MSSYCECCEFDAPNHSRYLKHLGTRKHAKRYLDAIKHLDNPNQNIVFSQSSKERVQETVINEFKKKSQKYTQRQRFGRKCPRKCSRQYTKQRFGRKCPRIYRFCFLGRTIFRFL